MSLSAMTWSDAATVSHEWRRTNKEPELLFVILVQYVEGKGPSVGHEPEGRVSLERGHSVRASTH